MLNSGPVGHEPLIRRIRDSVNKLKLLNNAWKLKMGRGAVDHGRGTVRTGLSESEVKIALGKLKIL
jgi:hypothetical protein